MQYALEIVKLLCASEENLKTETLLLSNVLIQPRIIKIYCNILKQIVQE